MITPQPAALCIFCSYAHEDEVLFQPLKKALAALIRQEAVIIWHYGDLLPGDQWERRIERELNTADIILLLISPNFITSDYCWTREMQWAIARHEIAEARVIPILLKPTPNWKTTPLGALQALPMMAMGGTQILRTQAIGLRRRTRVRRNSRAAWWRTARGTARKPRDSSPR